MTERTVRSQRQDGNRRRADNGDGVDHVAVALQTLKEGVERIQTSDGFQQYLAALGHFHDYSVNNVMLILAQRPDAQRVASFNTWKTLGRHVNKGERGIRILVPTLHKEVDDESGEEHERLVGFRTGTVFDVSQTGGQELPTPPTARLLETVSDRTETLYGVVVDQLEQDGVTVRRGDTSPANGVYQPGPPAVVTVHERLQGDQKLKTLTHETGHHVALKRGYRIEREDEETIAESSAFVVMSRYGVDSAEYSLPYVAGWAEKPEVLRRNLGTIRRTSTVIIDMIESAASMQDTAAIPVYETRSGVSTPSPTLQA
jgi:antirestriction protein ArdC